VRKHLVELADTCDEDLFQPLGERQHVRLHDFPEMTGNKIKTHSLDLSERIDEFEKMKPAHKDALDALRHVGNYGSHEGQADKEALLDCFELLEDALSELIDEKKAMLAAKAQTLIQNKGKNEF
jgi:hypothetical protein